MDPSADPIQTFSKLEPKEKVNVLHDWILLLLKQTQDRIGNNSSEEESTSSSKRPADDSSAAECNNNLVRSQSPSAVSCLDSSEYESSSAQPLKKRRFNDSMDFLNSEPTSPCFSFDASESASNLQDGIAESAQEDISFEQESPKSSESGNSLQPPNDFSLEDITANVCSPVSNTPSADSAPQENNENSLKTDDPLCPSDTNRKHRCHFCNKSFSSPSALSRHERIHTGDAPFQCDFCTRRFKQKGTLMAHLRVHTGEMPFECPLDGCRMKFRHRSSMRRHVTKCKAQYISGDGKNELVKDEVIAAKMSLKQE